MNRVVRPGETIGIVGGGQLGTMITREAHRMGYRVAAVDPDPECPLAARADVFLPGAYGDEAVIEALARASDVVTVETEHVPAAGLERIERIVSVRPRAAVLAAVQDRLAQREFLSAGGFPQTRFAAVSTREELERAVGQVGTPGILKLRRGGYDGKGQAYVGDVAESAAAWDAVGRGAAVYEAFVPFEREVSVLVARGTDGSTVHYPLAENEHRDGILHMTRVPARASADVEARAQALATAIATTIDHVGVMAVEMFLDKAGGLLVNEIAPRIHNSGHYTAAACSVPQAEQHVRAITGHPLAPPRLHGPVTMLNILGDAWAEGEPDWEVVLGEPRAQLHLYGKKEARPGRKMGHVIVLAPAADEAQSVAESIHRRLLPQRAVGMATPPRRA